MQQTWWVMKNLKSVVVELRQACEEDVFSEFNFRQPTSSHPRLPSLQPGLFLRSVRAMSGHYEAFMEARATPTVDNTLGALLFGTLLSMTLWGVTCAQIYEYFMNYKDSLRLRLIIFLLWVIDTFSTAMNAQTIYHYLVKNYANTAVLTTLPWGITSQPLVSGVSNLIVRTMYARRIYLISKRNLILILSIMSLAICNFVLIIFATINQFQNKRLTYVSFALAATCDLLVAISLCWYLYSNRTGFRRTDTLVNTLMIYVVSTGLIVVIDTTAGLITYVAIPNALVHVAILMPLNKLYVGAFLASLNARARLRGKDEDISVRLPTSNGRHLESAILTSDDETGASRPPTLAIQVKLRTSVERTDDDGVKYRLS